MTRLRSTSPGVFEEGTRDAAGALHEVSNALTVVLGWLDVATSELPAGAARDALEVARTHARLGYGIARSAIGAEVPDADEASLEQDTAADVAHRAITGVTPEARRRGVELAVEAKSSGRSPIRGSIPALQILTNLLLNAIAFTPRGRSVTLSLRERDASVVYSVKDQGPGLPPERAATLFDEPPVSTRRGGAGIGLRHSYEIAAAQGGELSVGDAESGARFDLRWPLAEARSSTRPQASALGSIAGKRTLILEDDAAIRSLIELSLDARGAHTFFCATAAEFDAAVARGSYDVALIDLSPIADQAGPAVARLKRQSPGVGVILISGLASGVPQGLESEIHAWVRKPFEMGEVLSAMASHFSARAVALAAG